MTGPSETRILLYILAQLQERYPDSLWERKNVVVAQAGDRFIKAGTKGQADIGGCYRKGNIGLFVELEVKTPTGRQTPSQKERQAHVTRAGGIYAVVHSLEEALAVIAKL